MRIRKRIARFEYGRSARDIGDERDVPFVSDVIESARDEVTDPSEIVILTNADSCLAVETVELISAKLQDDGACWSNRWDIDKAMRTQLSVSQIKERGESHRGLDLLAFRWKWWEDVLLAGEYGDFSMGYEAWDAIFILMLGGERQIVPSVVYHENHQTPYWARNRTTSRGNLWNRSLARKWIDSHGMSVRAGQLWPGTKQYI